MFAHTTTAVLPVRVSGQGTHQAKQETAVAVARFTAHCGNVTVWQNRDARNTYQGKEGNQT